MTSVMKCWGCDMEHNTLYEGQCSECYTYPYCEILTSVHIPNYKLYRIGYCPNRNYCAYKVYFDKDGEQEGIALMNHNDEVVKYIKNTVLMVGEYDQLILQRDVPNVFKDNFTVIYDWKE